MLKNELHTRVLEILSIIIAERRHVQCCHLKHLQHWRTGLRSEKKRLSCPSFTACWLLPEWKRQQSALSNIRRLFSPPLSIQSCSLLFIVLNTHRQTFLKQLFNALGNQFHSKRQLLQIPMGWCLIKYYILSVIVIILSTYIPLRLFIFKGHYKH